MGTGQHSPLQIGHVLFIDIVGYSKLLVNEQSDLLHELNDVVTSTPQFREAEAQQKLVRLPTGDGMALVFRDTPERPTQCAFEIARALKERPRIALRMGIHSGPVNEVVDVNQRQNIAGAGINTAQRVMDCGDAGHILVSKHVAEDLEQHDRWRSLLHDLGSCEVKHGVRVDISNLYSDEVGNSQLPTKFEALKKHRSRVRWVRAAIALLVLAVVAAAFLYLSRRPSRLLSAAEKSIAVLPFENLSEEKANAFFADGVQDEILTNLARIADLKVISRTSVIGYRDTAGRNLRKIGQELGVAHVLEGSVQRAANKVRVNAQLIDARNDAHLWAQTYDRDLADVFAIQSEIAKSIAEQLQAKLSPRERKAIDLRPTNDLVAFDLYNRARALAVRAMTSSEGKRDLLQAIDFLNEAVTRDPSFLAAYCQLANAHDTLYVVGLDHTPERLALAEAAIEAAARLRPDAGETHLARAQNFYQGHLDYAAALAELELARQTLPNDARIYELMGFIQRRQKGRYEESTRTLERALELDPRSILTLQQIAAFNYPRLKRHADARSAWNRLLAIQPEDVATKIGVATVDFDSKADTQPLHQTIDLIKGANSARLQDIADSAVVCALAERDAAAAKNAAAAVVEKTVNLSAENILFNRPFVEGLIARMTGDDAAARSAFTAARAEQEKIVQAQPNYAPALCVLGLIDAGLDRKEDAIREGRRAVELVPVEKDLPDGMDLIKYLAVIAAWVGDKDLACEQLEIAAYGPSGLSYGELKLAPFWDPLRGDPRFEKIVASLGPK